MSYPGSALFKALTDEEEHEFRQYAQKNNPPHEGSWELYHPVCREEWVRRGLKDPSNPDGITDVHGTPVHDELACTSDCINCGEHVEGAADRLSIVHIDPDGTLNTLEEWKLCPDCKGSQGAALVQYVKLSLA